MDSHDLVDWHLHSIYRRTLNASAFKGACMFKGCNDTVIPAAGNRKPKTENRKRTNPFPGESLRIGTPITSEAKAKQTKYELCPQSLDLVRPQSAPHAAAEHVSE